MLQDRVLGQPFLPWQVFALILLAVVVALMPLAYASPPDPIWIQGIYDAGDYDDVVVFLTETGGAAECGPQAASAPLPRPPVESPHVPS